jgi:protein-disulfide isomerase
MAAAVKKTNWFAVWVTVAVLVVVVAVGGLVVWMNTAASAPAVAPSASNIDEETGAIVFGDGEDVVETYVDFMCPICNTFEEAEGERIQELVASGDITFELHPVSILDRASQGTEFSSRSAAAMYSVAAGDPDNAYAFLKAMYENQPAEGSSGLTDEQIVNIAREAGVNVTDELERSILEHEYLDYAKSQELPEGATGTPTLVINGERIQVTFDPEVDLDANLG